MERIDRLQEQKYMRLRERQDRKDKLDYVTKLLKVWWGDRGSGGMLYWG